MRFHEGDRVIITDVGGDDHETVALSGVVEAKGPSRLSVVWVNRPLRDGSFEPCPWPVEYVRHAPDELEPV